MAFSDLDAPQIIKTVHNSTTDALTMGGLTGEVTATFTRPSDTTAYAVSDVVCNSTSAPAIMTFSNCARLAAGSGYITNVRLMKSSNSTTNAQFRLYLFKDTITPINDNAPYTLLWANRAKRIGYVDFTMLTEGTGSDAAMALATNVNLKFVCMAGSKDLYGVLVARGAYTPANGEQFFVELGVERN